MNTTRAVFFDAVGTLLRPEPSAAAVYAAAARRFGSRHTQEVIAARFAAAFERQEDIDRARGWCTSRKREHQRWRDIVGEVLDDVADHDACFASLYAHFARPDSWRCDPECAALLRDLSGRGYRLGLASNLDERLYAIAQGIDALEPLRTCLVVSSDVGWRKPSAMFFQKMCLAAELDAGEILFIGDDLDNDYKGAVAAGLRTVLFDPRDKHVNVVVDRIGALREAPAFLK